MVEYKDANHRSLRESVLDLIGKFLYDENFPKTEFLSEGILSLVNSTSAYHEEGEALYPEIFITNKLGKVLEALPFCKRVEIGRSEMSLMAFSRVLKLCAPLSRDGWVIYINVDGAEVVYGLVSTEITELSPSFRKQTVGELCECENDYSIAYLKNVGDKSVLLKGSQTEALICFSLNKIGQTNGDLLGQLCRLIGRDLSEDYKEVTVSYLDKLFAEAFLSGHGNLVGVVDDKIENIEKLKNRHPDGIYLDVPIDLYDLILTSERDQTREASTANKLYASIVKSMLNHDGVAVLSTSAKVLGYHIFVRPAKSDEQVDADIDGGARRRAFEVMKKSDVFCACFYKSQDGNEKFWSNE